MRSHVLRVCERPPRLDEHSQFRHPNNRFSLARARSLFSEQIKLRVEQATVAVVTDDSKFGPACGFVVPGGVILTAAHSVTAKVPRNSQGEVYEEHVSLITCRPPSSDEFQAQVLAVEPFADIAVLGCVDGLRLPQHKERFQRFVKSVDGGLKISEIDRNPLDFFDIRIRSPEGVWIVGKATEYNEDSRRIYALTKHPIPPGTSGSAVLDEAGDVCAVVSNSSEKGVRNPVASRQFTPPPGYESESITDGIHASQPCITGMGVEHRS